MHGELWGGWRREGIGQGGFGGILEDRGFQQEKWLHSFGDKSDLTHVLLSAAYTLNWWPREYNQKFVLLKVKVGPVDRSQISLVFGLHCQCLIRAHGRKYSRINVSKFLQLLIAVKDLLWNDYEICLILSAILMNLMMVVVNTGCMNGGRWLSTVTDSWWGEAW